MRKEFSYFKTVLMCVACKNISIFVDWLTELTAYSDSIVVFPLSFTFSSSVTQFPTVTATEEIWCNAGFTHYTIVHSAGDSDSGAQRAMRKTKKRPATHTIFHYTTHICNTHKAQCVTLRPLPVQQFGFLRLRGPYKHNTQVNGLQECFEFALPALTHSLSLWLLADNLGPFNDE